MGVSSDYIQRAEIGEKHELYLGDSYKIISSITGIDALISDVPYGMNYKPGKYLGKNTTLKSVVNNRNNTPVIGDNKPFDPTLFLPFKYVALFGAHHYSSRLPSSRGWLIWDKKPKGYPNNQFSDGDLIWTNQDKPIRVFRYLWQGALREGGDNAPHLHPTEKPVALMRWIIAQLNIPKGATICDPFMGSGPIGIAALELGYKFIGVEIVEHYFDIAKKRIDKAIKQPGLELFPTGVYNAGPES